MPHGELTVVVESATGIKRSSKHGSGDSYCTLQCGTQLLSTHIANGEGSDPLFHTEFQFEIDRSTNDLVICVYIRDSITGVDHMAGSIALDFKTVFFHAHAVPLTAYPLTRRSGKPGGHISISLKFKARPSPYARNNLHPVAGQYAAPPHAAPHRQVAYEDGYGSSGSDSAAHGHPPGHHRRSQSQPQHHDDYRPQPQQYNYARPVGAAPPAAAVPHRAMATGVRPQRAVGGPQQPRHHPQQPRHHPQLQQQQQLQQADPWGMQPGPQQRAQQEPPPPQMPGVAAQVGAQVAKVVAQQVLQQGVQAALGSLFGG